MAFYNKHAAARYRFDIEMTRKGYMNQHLKNAPPVEQWEEGTGETWAAFLVPCLLGVAFGPVVGAVAFVAFVGLWWVSYPKPR